MSRAAAFTLAGALLLLLSLYGSSTIRDITLAMFLRPVFENPAIDIEAGARSGYSILNWMRTGFLFEVIAAIAMLYNALRLHRDDPKALPRLRKLSWAVLIIPVVAIVMMDLASHRLVLVSPRPAAALRWLTTFHHSALIILGIVGAGCGALTTIAEE